LKCLLLGAVLSAAAWVCCFWADRPWLAVAGAVLIASGWAIVLALEFIGLGWLGTDRQVAQPTGRQLLRAWWGEVRCVLVVFAWRQAFRSRAEPDWLPPDGQGRGGAVFIHGFVSNRGLWTPWLARLRAAGRAFVALDLEPVFGSIDDYVALIEDAVTRVTEATHRPPVLVCHSMGGLAARAWLRQHSGAHRVARIITIGTPHHGTALARLSGLIGAKNARQMHPAKPWLRDMFADESSGYTTMAKYKPFVCYYSNSDNIVMPASTACLPGADNRHVPGVAHVALALDARVMAESLALILGN
jgi:triacylglycerol esterase/lipase EstA (alpha/beta hydrolase family)